mmetsp:Transcript_24223/g.40124  ORF Transcript_24223/g.40124 Transcript_24223/m.40124 type:complete len:285 (-) Transcript_24223:217-1071(-)
MAKLGANEISRQEGNSKAKLTTNNGSTEYGGWILQSHECKEVHSLVIGFFQKHLEETTITLHCAKTLEMTDNGSNHTWDCCHGLQVDNAIQDVFGVDVVTPPASCRIEEEPEHLDGTVCQVVADSNWLDMSDLDVQLLFRIEAVRLASVHVFSSTATDTEGVPLSFLEVLVGSTTPLGALLRILCAGSHKVDGFNESIKRDRSASFPSVKELTNVNNLLVSECFMVLVEKFLELFRIEPSVRVGINLHQLGLNLSNNCHIKSLESLFNLAHFSSSTSKISCSNG